LIDNVGGVHQAGQVGMRQLAAEFLVRASEDLLDLEAERLRARARTQELGAAVMRVLSPANEFASRELLDQPADGGGLEARDARDVDEAHFASAEQAYEDVAVRVVEIDSGERAVQQSVHAPVRGPQPEAEAIAEEILHVVINCTEGAGEGRLDM